VNPRDRLARAERRLLAQKVLEFLVFQDALDHPDAVGALGVARPHVMQQAIAMAEDERAHG
jgi:hypothetical protein